MWVDRRTPERDDPGFAPDVFTDKLGVIGAGYGRVRPYHASSDAPVDDVAVVGPNDEPAAFLVEGLTVWNAGPNDDVLAGAYPVAVYHAGETTPVFGPVDVEVRDAEVRTSSANAPSRSSQFSDSRGESAKRPAKPPDDEVTPHPEANHDTEMRTGIGDGRSGRPDASTERDSTARSVPFERSDHGWRNHETIHSIQGIDP